jgi:hypothetical protein
MRWSELMERSGPAVLYHATDADAAARIIYTDTLLAKTTHRGSRLGFPNASDVDGVSLTRSYSFAKQFRDTTVIFVLDERKLRQRHRVKPIAYYNNRKEAEEFVLGPIHPLSHYLVEILIPRSLYDVCIDDNEDYVDPHSVGDTRYAALTDHPLLRII